MKRMRGMVFILVLALFSGQLAGQTVYEVVLKAEAFNKSGDPDAVIKMTSPFITNSPDSRLYVKRAEAYMAKRDYDSATDDYISAGKMKAGSGDYGLSRLYAIRGDAANAVKYLERDMAGPDRKSEKIILLDPAFSRIENAPEWRQFWKKDWYSATEKDISQLEYQLSSGKKEEASRIVASLEQDYPGEVVTDYAKALLKNSLGEYNEAVKLLTSLIARDPVNEKYLTLLARVQVNVSNFAGASATYSKMISLEIADATLFLKRAECYVRTGELKSASADIEKYLSLYPADENAIRQAGRVKAASGDNLGALESYSENIRLHPGDAECYNDRGNAYFISKSWDWAIKDFTMSLDLEPGNSDVWLNKGIALINKGNDLDACHDFRMAFKLGNKKATEYISRYCIK